MAFSAAAKRVLITGASSGVGAALARRLVAHGAVVGLIARRRDRLAAVLADCRTTSPDSTMWVVDLGDTATIGELGRQANVLAAAPDRQRELIVRHDDLHRVVRFVDHHPADLGGLGRQAWDALGGSDVLINNAAVPKRRAVTDLDPFDAEAVMRVNFFAPMHLILAVLPLMLARDSGIVVNVSSIGGRLVASPSPWPSNRVNAARRVCSSAVRAQSRAFGPLQRSPFLCVTW